METGCGTDEMKLSLQGSAVSGLNSLQVIQVIETLIDEGLVGEGPQLLGRL